MTCAGGGTATASWNPVSGVSLYRYQFNSSASTAGAVTFNTNGTSFARPVVDPTATHYFRVRVQTVTNAASCNAVGSWSAWQPIAGNASCVVIPATCDRPTGLTASSACNLAASTGTISSSWDKMTSALGGYEYQLSRASNWTAANRVITGTVAQTLGTVDPEFNYSYPTQNPPTLYLRTRSLCAASTQSPWTPWRSIVFSPALCGGPTPTPLAYDVSVNLRTSDGTCNPSNPLLSGTFDGRVVANPVGPGANIVENTTSPTLTFQNLQGQYQISPNFNSFGDSDIPSWVRATGPTCNGTQVQTVSAADTLNFYFTEVKGPWWQTSFGDVFANSIVSSIPTTATNANLSINGAGSEAGAVVWQSSVDVGTGSESQKGYRVPNESVTIAENYAYFVNKLGSPTTSNPNDVNAIQANTDRVYQLTGNQTLNTSKNFTGKAIVLIDGSLRVSGANPITVGPNGFVMFVVNGPITFAADVNDVYGMFVARDDITIEYDISNQTAFTGHGSFISTGGDISSSRSLAGNGNSTNPATEFIYDPRLVLNTPLELRTNTTVWQEVAP